MKRMISWTVLLALVCTLKGYAETDYKARGWLKNGTYVEKAAEDFEVGDDLTVTDDAAVGGDATVTGTVSAEQLTSTDDATVGDDLGVGGLTTSSELTVTNTVIFSGLPTSTNGLAAGTVWDDSGTLKIMQ